MSQTYPLLDRYWRARLDDLAKALARRGFEVFQAETADSARDVVLHDILPASGGGAVAFGGSATVVATGLFDSLAKSPPANLTVIDTYDTSLSPEERITRRRVALTADVLITGTNAVTEDGRLVNLDGTGNRVAGLAFGPKSVVVLVGRNKLVDDLDAAFARIKGLAAPVNAARLGRKTPCATLMRCADCDSPERICSVWSITERAYPKGRIKVVIINQELGF